MPKYIDKLFACAEKAMAKKRRQRYRFRKQLYSITKNYIRHEKLFNEITEKLRALDSDFTFMNRSISRSLCGLRIKRLTRFQNALCGKLNNIKEKMKDKAYPVWVLEQEMGLVDEKTHEDFIDFLDMFEVECRRDLLNEEIDRLLAKP